ncbi:YeiH family protein [Ruminiclostridium cellulolyticum]|uniref:Uncharacterized protein n=1 Tax=Ruminiclostridium cellulolyticum (strain ATCC 35319 / DSM 5812 / JCM 6584 / H10) TaxID=394503 RepID=B8I786_RUMCH|nr:YeiH family protein [Ruminiclostridium cellulolyticum]ACL75010.1 conserved hypothetical protein [Ruminiclostridium cellulolyticum H10]
MVWIRKNTAGILLALGIAIVASWLGGIFPIIGGPVFGILFGIIINNTIGKPAWSESGVKFTSKKILQYAIVLLGTGLSLTQVWKTGLESLYVMLFTLSFAFISAYGFGKLLKVPFNLTSLIGVGTAICGGSAIAAVSPIIEAEEKEVAYSISTIFFFNILAVLIFPPLGHLLGFSDTAFGLWAGTAINDTSSVVAAGYAYSNTAGAYATIVKLTRTTMIIPISLVYAAVTIARKRKAAKQDDTVSYSFKSIFPWFIVAFLAASLLNTLGVFSSSAVSFLSGTGKFFIVMALSAVGLNANFKEMLKTGFKPLFLGLVVWFTVTIVSIVVQFMTGQV